MVTVAKVYEANQSSNDKEDSILFNNTFNNSAPDDPYDPPYIPDDPYIPDPRPTPVVPTPETPVNPPVLDARPGYHPHGVHGAHGARRGNARQSSGG